MNITIKFKAIMDQEIPDSEIKKIMKLYDAYSKEELFEKMSEQFQQQSGMILTKAFGTDYGWGFDFEVYESKKC